ncbi:MAG: polysaccharide pyruvyl transferase CsaB, partial [Firmicutes bacterium]|nr:polysaccharide pyruvyl transferase CsaB [Bacillota bacterium]
PRLYLRIAGTGEEEQSLREQVKDLGLQDAVEFAGWITDMPGFFAGVDINVLPSFSEGFPYSLLEGAYDRCPAIASAVGGIPEIIDHNETGLLFEPHDVSTLTAHILLLARDPQLRRRLGDNLWQRARRDFSLEKMRETQEQVYASVLRRREHRGKRWGAVICGAYGRGNAGDDAILQAITSQMREIDPDMPLTVVSRNPKDTRLKNRTGAIYTFDLFSFWHRLRRSRLFINGGGSLIQDVTSSRSLYYYLFTLWMARRSGCRVLMYGCGIGPIKRRFNQKLAARILNRNVEVITLRDSNSRRVLAEMQVDKPRVILAADPTVNLVRSGRIGVASSFARESIPADAPKVAFCIRSWPSFIHPEYLAAAADHVYNSYGFLPVFIPIELPRDVEAASRVIQSMHVPYHACTQRYNVDELIGMLGSMKLVVGMRLHSLIFATLGRAPVVALSYDVKVSSFIRDIGGGHCMPVDSFTAEELIAAIDDVVAAGCPRAGEARECLLHGEECNIAAARGLLEDDR